MREANVRFGWKADTRAASLQARPNAFTALQQPSRRNSKTSAQNDRGRPLSLGPRLHAVGVTGAAVPVPYVAQVPGPTYNTLGDIDGTPIISVHGRPRTRPAW